jgi:hypothetical protein
MFSIKIKNPQDEKSSEGLLISNTYLNSDLHVDVLR